jgi:hypothetical protein
MRSYIYQSLMFFRNIFSRHSTWLLFRMVILGFIGAGEMVGVTSFCRFWGIGEKVKLRERCVYIHLPENLWL